MCSLLLLNIVTIRGNISKDKTTFFSPWHTLRSRFVFATLVSFLKIHRLTIIYLLLLISKIVHGIFIKQMISSHWTNLSIFNFCTIDQDNFKWKPRSLPFFVFFLHILFIKVLLNRKYYYRTITMNDSANWFLRRCL